MIVISIKAQIIINCYQFLKYFQMSQELNRQIPQQINQNQGKYKWQEYQIQTEQEIQFANQSLELCPDPITIIDQLPIQNLNNDLNVNSTELNYSNFRSEIQNLDDQNHKDKADHVKLKKLYYTFFEDCIPKPQKYIPNMPSDQDFKNHKIKYLRGNKFFQQLQSYHQPYIKIKYTQQRGNIVHYTVIIATFELEIIMLNIDYNAPQEGIIIGQGRFGSVRIESQSKRKFAVKRQIFQNTYNLKEFNMMANKDEINQVIKQLAIYKICSLFKIGPAVDKGIGFDLICYRDCIQFQIQLCIKIQHEDIIFVDQNKFKKQIKQCLLILHFFRIIHKDIKPGNILFSNRYNKYVMADFGISHSVVEQIGYLSPTGLQGTPKYMSQQMKKVQPRKIGMVDLYGNDVHSLKIVLEAQKNNRLIQEEIKYFQKDISNKEFITKNEYEYLKLKYYCIKADSKMEEVQSNWELIDMTKKKQLIQIVDKSMQYNKIKSVYNYLSKLLIFREYQLDNLRIQAQCIESINLNHQYRQMTELELKNMTRVYGYSLEVKQMIIKLKQQQKYKNTIKSINKNFIRNNRKQVNYRDLMLVNHIKYVRYIKKNLQKLQKQKNYKEIFKNYMIILQYGDFNDKQQVIQKLQILKYERNKAEQIQQIIRVTNAEFTKYNIKKFEACIQKQDQQLDIILCDLKLYNDLASIYEYLGRYKIALKYYHSHLKLDIAQYGQQYPTVAAIYNNIGFIYFKMNEFEQALNYYEMTLKIDRSLYGQQHPNIAISYNNIGLANNQLNKNEEAIKYYARGMRLFKSFYEQRHHFVITINNNIATVYSDLGKYKIALQYLKRNLQLQEEGKYSSISKTYSNIATTLNKMGQYKKAIYFYTKSINQYLCTQQYSQLAFVYLNLSYVYDNLGYYQTALNEILLKEFEDIQAML